MAKDAYIAGVAALLGVGLSGGIQAGLAIRTDRRNRRQAVRLIRSELTGMRTTVQLALANRTMRVSALASAEDPPEYERLRDALARDLSDVHWANLATAYTRYAITRNSARSVRDLDVDEGLVADPFLTETIKAIGRAQTSLTPILSRPGAFAARRRVDRQSLTPIDGSTPPDERARS